MSGKVRVGRRAYFSCGHSYKLQNLTEEESKKLWGELYAPGGWGKNFVLEAGLELAPPGSDGLSFSLTEVDAALDSVAKTLDHAYLNTDVEYFFSRVPSTENVARFVFEELRKKLGAKVKNVKLIEDESSWVEYSGEESFKLTQTFKISALHRHHNPDLSREENERLYTKCATLHGHQYLCEVSYQGPLTEPGQILVRREDFGERVRKAIIEPFHGSVLNELIGNTSGELLFRKLDEILNNEFGANYGGLLLRETRKNSFQGAAV